MRIHDIDVVDKSIVEFILSLPLDPDGTRLRIKGIPLFRLMPILPDHIATAEEWTDADIARRCDLVEKDVKGIITPAESIELESLTENLRKFRRLHAAIVFDETRTILEELERKASESQS